MKIDLRSAGPALVFVLGLILTGCSESSSTAASGSGSETVCVDTKSKDVVVLSGVTRFPATNPATGEATLMPGMYCSDCQTWHVAPSIEQLHRQKGVAHCPKTGAALKADGPRPAAAPAS